MSSIFTPPQLIPKPKPSVEPETPVIPLARVNSTLSKNYDGFDYMLAQFVEQTQISPIQADLKSDFTNTLTIDDPSSRNTFIPPKLLPKKSIDEMPTIKVTFTPPRLLSKPSFVRQPSSLRNTYDETREVQQEQIDLFESEIVKKSPNFTDLNLFEREISLNRMKSLSKSPMNLFEKEISLQRMRSLKSPSESEISVRRSVSTSSRVSVEDPIFNSPDVNQVRAYWQISEEYNGI
ncbi:hypothetical protein HDV04_002180 [Boothiomyces sp. JEL0838]|nr:hypothetical protein HDV04_002180 [Boothiomyces sp. JEL0838]